MWRDDAIEFGIDGAGDRMHNPGLDDHQITLVFDGTVTDFRDVPVTEASSAIVLVAGGWRFRARLPPSVLNSAPLYIGKQIGFNVALDDDDDGGARDAYMAWAGEATYRSP